MHSDPFLDDVARSWQHLVPDTAAVLVAVSGGADSTALFHALMRLRQALSIKRLGVAHVNHGLRGTESDGDEAFVRSMASDAAVSCHVARLACGAMNVAGMEAWARRERYRFFHQVKSQERYDIVATAHTADDQAETLIMRLWRGAGMRGLVGIHAARADHVVRPLLGITRLRIAAWLSAQQIVFRHDSSNDDLRLRRNWIRHRLLPLLKNREPGIVRLLASCATDMAIVVSCMERLAAQWISSYVTIRGAHCFAILKEGLRQRHIAPFAVGMLLANRGCAVTRTHIDAILSCAQRSSGVFLLPQQWRCEAYAAEALLYRAVTAPTAPQAFCVELSIPGTTLLPQGRGRLSAEIVCFTPRSCRFDPTNITVFLDVASLAGGTLCYRSAAEKEMFHPLGANGPMPLNLFLKKHRVCRSQRRSVGVVSLLSGPIVWIPGIRISHSYRCTSNTRQALRLCLQHG